MSSHHVIRDKQEPALIIANGEACSEELLGQLLEWSPFVVVLDSAIHRVLDLGIKATVNSDDPAYFGGYMNANFINVKVDREERPDVDHIYMDALQAMTGSGGWPLNIFLLPDGKPFYGGTYFPPKAMPQRASWIDVLQGVKNAFENNYEKLVEQANELTNHVVRNVVVPIRGGVENYEEPLATKEEIENYNGMVKQINNEIQNYNKVNTANVNEKNNAISLWNQTGENFISKHVPQD